MYPSYNFKISLRRIKVFSQQKKKSNTHDENKTCHNNKANDFMIMKATIWFTNIPHDLQI